MDSILPETFDELFKELDLDGNGYIENQEMAAFVRSRMEDVDKFSDSGTDGTKGTLYNE